MTPSRPLPPPFEPEFIKSRRRSSPESAPRLTLDRAWSLLESAAAERDAALSAEARIIIERDRSSADLSSMERELLPFARDLARAERMVKAQEQQLTRAVFKVAESAFGDAE